MLSASRLCLLLHLPLRPSLLWLLNTVVFQTNHLVHFINDWPYMASTSPSCHSSPCVCFFVCEDRCMVTDDGMLCIALAPKQRDWLQRPWQLFWLSFTFFLFIVMWNCIHNSLEFPLWISCSKITSMMWFQEKQWWRKLGITIIW